MLRQPTVPSGAAEPLEMPAKETVEKVPTVCRCFFFFRIEDGDIVHMFVYQMAYRSSILVSKCFKPCVSIPRMSRSL